MKDLKSHLKINTPSLIDEIAKNPECSILRIPLISLKNILGQVASRASELNDVELNKLMMRLALYEIADPYSNEYDSDFVRAYIDQN